MDKTPLEKIEMKNDGKDAARFQAMLKKVVSVPKKDVDSQQNTSAAKTPKTR